MAATGAPYMEARRRQTSALAEVMGEHRLLNAFGIGVFDSHRKTPEQRRAELAAERVSLTAQEATVLKIAAWLRENIAPIRMPVLIIVGSEDRLLPLGITLHDELAKQGKAARLEIFEHGYHDFVLGNQGQERKDLPRGEILLPGALEALELTVKFLKDPR